MKKILLLFLYIFLVIFVSSCSTNNVKFETGNILSEDATKAALEIIDLNPSNQSEVRLIYSHTYVSKTEFNDTFNREHVWLDSLLQTNQQKRDLHNIRACNQSINNLIRANRLFLDKVEGGSYSITGESNQYFFPGDDDKGDVARIIMYMVKVYDLELAIIGLDNQTLIKWHEEDPVDDFEINRNEAIASLDLQGNRNPFIDDSRLAYKYFDTNSRSNLGTIWLVGLLLSVAGVIIVSKVETLAHKDDIVGLIVMGFLVFSLVCGFIWKWWAMLLILIIIGVFIYYVDLHDKRASSFIIQKRNDKDKIL